MLIQKYKTYTILFQQISFVTPLQDAGCRKTKINY